ncbi:MAG: hypothetical protein K8H88_09035, partial [Sandaracinaceae bacterium]|nr:hypothetical protein [Sandaracinaceae bacterium]
MESEAQDVLLSGDVLDASRESIERVAAEMGWRLQHQRIPAFVSRAPSVAGRPALEYVEGDVHLSFEPLETTVLCRPGYYVSGRVGRDAACVRRTVI